MGAQDDGDHHGKGWRVLVGDVRMKMAYNLTRPHRHGNKKL